VERELEMKRRGGDEEAMRDEEAMGRESGDEVVMGKERVK
jgi:hypothetical protein